MSHGNWAGIVCKVCSQQSASLFISLQVLPGRGVTIIGSKSGGSGQYKLTGKKKERRGMSMDELFSRGILGLSTLPCAKG
jgi:hypothetical protein